MVDVESLAEILVCCGFFLIYFVEESVHIACGTHQPVRPLTADEDGTGPNSELRSLN